YHPHIALYLYRFTKLLFHAAVHSALLTAVIAPHPERAVAADHSHGPSPGICINRMVHNLLKSTVFPNHVPRPVTQPSRAPHSPVFLEHDHSVITAFY